MIKFYHIDPETQVRGNFVKEFSVEDAEYLYMSSLKIHSGRVFSPILAITEYKKYGLSKGMYLTAEDSNGKLWRNF